MKTRQRLAREMADEADEYLRDWRAKKKRLAGIGYAQLLGECLGRAWVQVGLPCVRYRKGEIVGMRFVDE